jgi:peptide/nickel transport system permease protein
MFLLRFILIRCLAAIPVLFVISVVTFAIIQAPEGDYGDYIRSMLMNQGGTSAEVAEAQAQIYRERHGLNDPLVFQYLNWMWGIVTRFDFGQSLYFNKPVADVVSERLPRTIALALITHLFASVIGIAMGIIAASRQYSWIDSLFGAIAFLGMTVPRFLLALVIIYILAFRLNVQEFGSFYSSRYGGQPYWFGLFDFNWAKLWNLIQHVWPVIFIASLGGLAYNMRVMRANLLDVLNAQYIETARAKGMSRTGVLMKHAVPNALHPLVAHQGVVLPYMLTGEIEVAIVFGLPTVGPAITGAMAVGDTYVTATFVMVLAAALVIGNILADLLLIALDPRVRQELGARA